MYVSMYVCICIYVYVHAYIYVRTSFKVEKARKNNLRVNWKLIYTSRMLALKFSDRMAERLLPP